MIYVLLGIIGLLVIILVAIRIVLYKDRHYVYTREEFHERIKNIKENYDEAVDFLNNLIDEERKINQQAFSFNTKYNIGDNIWYVKDNKTYQGRIKTITTELFKSKDGIKATQYIYLLECGTNTKESEVICKQEA